MILIQYALLYILRTHKPRPPPPQPDLRKYPAIKVQSSHGSIVQFKI